LHKALWLCYVGGEIFLIADVTGKASKRNHIGVLEVKRGGKRLRA